ncbi:hypothetical protein IU501_04965 [Nocardia otitidiscaviarum]|uniref:hypothetical protein n=1 Tax=Nocardia otitidiscaviarum TaxID=1823 RepID=UPI000693774E|nr:hypothetical protein [Nocardia otitidiscaviarum]MBF6132345.1 hypothetical protein [Nocardia otitidiscaviarum]MBF6483437.1 hypothetical protein [Nocardia otitidiscaviarum]
MPQFDPVVVGAPETALTATLLRRLPAESVPAAWACEYEAVFWFDRAATTASRVLPPLLRGRARPLVVVGGFLRCADSPIGPHGKVLAAIGFRSGLRPRGHIAFMATDSESGLVGGRGNWALPVTLARFTGDLASGTVVAVEGDGDATPWTLGVTARAFGPAVPMRSTVTMLQQFSTGPLHPVTARARFRARMAIVDTTIDADAELPTWLRSGRRPGILLSHLRIAMPPVVSDSS